MDIHWVFIQQMVEVEEHAIKEKVTSMFALKVPVWLELTAEYKHVQ